MQHSTAFRSVALVLSSLLLLCFFCLYLLFYFCFLCYSVSCFVSINLMRHATVEYTRAIPYINTRSNTILIFSSLFFSLTSFISSLVFSYTFSYIFYILPSLPIRHPPFRLFLFDFTLSFLLLHFFQLPRARVFFSPYFNLACDLSVKHDSCCPLIIESGLCRCVVSSQKCPSSLLLTATTETNATNLLLFPFIYSLSSLFSLFLSRVLNRYRHG